MEAIEQVGKQHDSFEEVDRILTIVETNYEDYNKTNFMRSVVFPFTLFNLGLLVLSFFLINKYKITINFSPKYLFDANNLIFFTINILSLVSSSWSIFQYIKMKNKRKIYILARKQAIEVLREVIPVLSRHENWSALKKTEIRLRLSKLDISPEGILDDRRS